MVCGQPTVEHGLPPFLDFLGCPEQEEHRGLADARPVYYVFDRLRGGGASRCPPALADREQFPKHSDFLQELQNCRIEQLWLLDIGQMPGARDGDELGVGDLLLQHLRWPQKGGIPFPDDDQGGDTDGA
jgi:hypothetical protein